MSKCKRLANVRLPYLGIVGCIKFSPFSKQYFFEHKNDCAPRCVANSYERCELLVHLLCNRYEIELL